MEGVQNQQQRYGGDKTNQGQRPPQAHWLCATADVVPSPVTNEQTVVRFQRESRLGWHTHVASNKFWKNVLWYLSSSGSSTTILKGPDRCPVGAQDRQTDR